MRRIAVSIVCLAAVLVGPGAGAAPDSTAGYAALDRPGPPLSVPDGALRQALRCTAGLADTDREPVLLVPGTTVTPEEHYSWNWMPALDRLGWPYCTITTPHHATGDMQVAAEYVVYGIRAMFRASGRRIAVLGGSQGGSLPRWALRFWPDTRAMVEDHIGLAPTNHGGETINSMCHPDCVPALWQQRSGSAFMSAMNSGTETFPGISYTEIYSHQDQFVTPALDDTGTSSLHGGGGRVTNVAVQDICPVDVADHIKAASWDPVAYALVLDALTHDGPAEPGRVDRTVCGQAFPPGVDPVTFPGTYAAGNVGIMLRLMTEPRSAAEPALRSYVTAGG